MTASTPRGRRVLIVGAGLAGLLAAWRHSEAGNYVTVLERAPAIGGRLAPAHLAGLACDIGAESFSTRGASVSRLARQWGLEADIVNPEDVQAWIAVEGGAYPIPEATLVGAPARPWASDVRRAVGTVGALRATLGAWATQHTPRADDTWGTYVERRFGRRVRECLADPIARGVYSSPSVDVPVTAVAPDLVGPHAKRFAEVVNSRPVRGIQGLVGGVWRLAERAAEVARAAGATIETEVNIDALTLDHDRWTAIAGERTWTADEIVLACEPIVAEHLVRSTVSAPPPAVAPAPITIVLLAFRESALDGAPLGSGVLSSRGDVEARALTHATAKWGWLQRAMPGTHVVRLSYDGARNGDETVAKACADASALFGIGLESSTLIDSATRVWPGAAGRAVDLGSLAGVSAVGAAAGATGIAAIVAEHEEGSSYGRMPL